MKRYDKVIGLCTKVIPSTECWMLKPENKNHKDFRTLVNVLEKERK